MKKLFAMLVGVIVTMSCQLALAAPAMVSDVKGAVQAIPGAGAPRTLRKGDEINRGETIVTADNSFVILRFEDGQVVGLTARSRLTVNDYVYNQAEPTASNMLLSLINGGMRTITGLIGKRTPTKVAYRVGNATIGIRGTDITGVINGTTIAVTVGSGKIDFTFNGQTVEVNAGQGVLTLPNGQIQVTSIADLIAALRAQGNPAANDLDSMQSEEFLNAFQQALVQAEEQGSDLRSTATPGPGGPTGGAGGGGSSKQ